MAYGSDGWAIKGGPEYRTLTGGKDRRCRTCFGWPYRSTSTDRTEYVSPRGTSSKCPVRGPGGSAVCGAAAATIAGHALTSVPTERSFQTSLVHPDERGTADSVMELPHSVL
ncbi:MAG: hypothetical protein JRM99_06925 [Nitrososphaerota archaeon]|nr:hypothetical protein [Nitrososphaerota archaeon]